MTVGELMLVEGGTRLRLSRHDGRLQVRTYAGELLDPAAAQVLIALGGKEPEWVPMVRGLEAADAASGGDDEQVLAAGKVLARRAAVRIETARTTESAVIRRALAAYGVYQVVRNPALTAVEWDLVRNHPDPDVARRADAAAEILPGALYDHPDPATRARVARNPAVAPSVIDGLADDEDSDVQQAAASNRSCPAAALRRMTARNPRDALRITIASNPAADRATLRRCLRDPNHNVQAAAVSNPSLSKRSAMRRLGSRWSTVRRSLAGRTDHTLRTLTWLERCSRRDAPYWQSMIRMRIRSHPVASEALKERIDQLNLYSGSRKGSTPPTPFLRRLAWPAPTEALALMLGVLAIAVGILGAFRAASFASLILVGATVALIVSPRLRTVRNDTQVRVSCQTKKVPSGERLNPVVQAGRGRAARPVRARRGVARVAWVAGVIGVQALIHLHHSNPTPSPPTFPPLSDLPSVPGLITATPQFVYVEIDTSGPATDATAADDFAAARELENYLEPLSQWGNGLRESACKALDTNLVSLLAGPETPAAWNANEANLRLAMATIASTGG